MITPDQTPIHSSILYIAYTSPIHHLYITYTSVHYLDFHGAAHHIQCQLLSLLPPMRSMCGRLLSSAAPVPADELEAQSACALKQSHFIRGWTLQGRGEAGCTTW